MKRSPSPANDPPASREPGLESAANANPDEVRQLQHQLECQAREIVNLQSLISTDPLTGIGNRRRFDEELARNVAEFDRLQRGFCLVLIDFDEFREINDRLGHPGGDQVLVTFARSLRKQLRATDIFARIGGDEFAIIFPATDVETARSIVHRARQKIADELKDINGSSPVEWSAGFAEMQSGTTSRQLIAAADKFMYAAKREQTDQAPIRKEKPGTRPGSLM